MPLSSLYKNNKLLLAILALSIILRLAFLDTSYIFWDESVYLMGGKVLAGQHAGYHELDFRHPLLTVLIAPLALLGYYLYLSKIFMIIINTILIIIIYIFGKQFNKKIGLLSAFLVSIWPYHLMSSSWVMTDGLAAVTLLSTIMLYFKGFKQNKNYLVYLGGFFLSLAILSKLTNLLLLILILPLIILNIKKIEAILKSLLIAFLMLSPYLAISYLKFGNPLHGVLKAFRIGNTVISSIGSQPISIISKVFYDFFGIVLSVLIFAGVLLFLKKEVASQKDKKVKKENLFWFYCFAMFLPYYIYIVHEGATPIWWDSQRFLLSFLPFGLIFSSYFITEVVKNFSEKLKLTIMVVLIFLVLISWTQQYSRFAQPAINYEEGLRHATKELGTYLKNEDLNEALCLGNCPPIAYYSDKKLLIIYDIKDFKLTPGQYGIIFSDNIGKLSQNYYQIKTFCRQNWCAYLLKNTLKY